ncbi:MAG: hypothetical protein NTX61_14390 [Bacteroidetes bacterium]|nr:hypothetical protein [Bacteroidota bacterium]
MKQAIILSVFFILSNISCAQWTWQNPLPQGNRLGNVFFTDENHGFVTG